jgi:hypothetical protein
MPPSGGTRTSLVDEQGRPLVLTGQALGPAVTNSDFSPGQPIAPVREEPVRVWDFPVSVNTQIPPRPASPFGFAHLRAFANVEPVRLAIETRKDQIERLDWKVKAVDEKAARKDATAAARIARIAKLLKKPDGMTPFATWLRPALEDLLALDASAFEKRRNRGGELIGLDVVPGDTIKLLVDETGRRPLPPYPAYQQIIKGRVWANLTSDDLLYSPRNRRPNHVMGFSPVEQIIVTIQTVINRQTGQLAYFTEGNTPAGFLTGPDGWQPAQIKEMQTWLDARLSGDIGQRQKALFLPHGTTWNPFKQPPLKDEFDEWLYRIVAFAFSLPPTPFIKQMNRSTSDNDQDRGLEEGLEPLKLWIARLITGVIQDDCGEEGLEFAWVETPSIDPKVQAEIDDKNLRNGSAIIDEVRDGRGLDPLPNGQGAQPLLYTSTGAMTLEQVLDAADKAINPVEPPTPLPDNQAPAPGQGEPGKPAVAPAPAAKLAKARPDVIRADRPKARRHAVALRKALTPILAKCGDEVAAEVGMQLRGLHKAAAADAGLYVSRNLTADSAAKFTKWATGQGFTNLTPPEELHATIVYSRKAVDFTPEISSVTVKDDGNRTVEPLGAGDVDLSKVIPYGGDLEFGPEVHAPLNENWAEDKGFRKAADDAGSLTNAELAKRIAEAVSLAELDQISTAAYDDLFEVAQDSATLGLASVGVQTTDDLTNQVFERAVAYAKQRAAELVSLQGPDNIVQSTRDMIRDVIAKGLDDNIGASKIADAVQASTAFSEDRADLIARTEISMANGAGKLAAWQESGLDLQKSWITFGACCDDCAENEAASPIALDDAFPSGDDAEPGHPNCKCACVAEPVPADDADETDDGE